MLGRWQFATLTGLGALSLLLVVVNAALFVANRDLQAETAQRQQFIQQSIALESLYREIVKAIAELGTRGNDRALLDILASQGLSVTATPAGAATPPAAPALGGERRP
jgi:hypothetical protein